MTGNKNKNVIPCVICGTPIVDTGHSKYCPECRKEVRRRQNRESCKRSYERKKQEVQAKKKAEGGWNDKWCKGCKYGVYVQYGSRHYICGYWEQVGHMRPCKAGPECTVRVARKR